MNNELFPCCDLREKEPLVLAEGFLHWRVNAAVKGLHLQDLAPYKQHI